MDTERDYSEYDFDPEIGTHEGFSVGDQVVITEDHEEMGYFEGEEGTVIGFSNIAPATDRAAAMAFGNDPDGRVAIYVLMDGTDEPIEIKPGKMSAT